MSPRVPAALLAQSFRFTFALSLALVAGAGCAHSADCRQRISDCLARCPPAEPTAEIPRGNGQGEPMRLPSTCEQRCQGGCADKTSNGPIEPATSPTGR